MALVSSIAACRPKWASHQLWTHELKSLVGGGSRNHNTQRPWRERKPGGEYKFLPGNTSPFLPSPQPLINTMSTQRFASSSSRHEAPHLLASETLERQGKACWLPAHNQTPDFC
ncbi:hypothetical protein LEMLEM_LOCUS16337 [Lemmus lemmus]